jgi:hypothetical protein
VSWGDEAVRPDGEQRAHEGGGRQQRPHPVLEGGIVLRDARRRRQALGEPRQHQVHRLDGALGLLAQQVAQSQRARVGVAQRVNPIEPDQQAGTAEDNHDHGHAERGPSETR